ncbi:adenylate/guanylate cyclase domain-containing protein [Oscillatoria sp. FACHB-1406]|uniref:adenylate/guanylate cyclase domain-containing protein n=1 Tax=Oscillatoria sp. FACHB-1406 TaxID=2692846 RepID=UPI001686CEDC|nr:adenylate/guanylate cyclase domain-containing protein [Oscillatoria sp. FACHB-1406]MBD2580572.1 PAS domain S-box protein [Oscillatoria sp. FACHB-1406]
MVLRKWTRRNNIVPLRWVMLLPLLGQIFVAVGLTGYLAWRNGSQAVEELAEQLGQETTNQVKQYINNFTEVPVLFLELNESSLEASQFDFTDIARLKSIFWKQLQLSERVTTIEWVGQDGQYLRLERGKNSQMIIRNPATASKAEVYRLDDRGNPGQRLQVKSYDPRTEGWYRAAARSRQFVWSPLYELPNSSAIGMTSAIPIYDAGGQHLGAIAVDLQLDSLSHFLQTLYSHRPSEVAIIERTGKIVASSSSERIYRQTPSGKELLRIAESRDPEWRQVASAIEQRFGSFQKLSGTRWFRPKIEGKRQFVQVTNVAPAIGLDWLLIVVIPESELTEQIRDITNKTIVLCLLLLSAAVTLGVYTSRWLEGSIGRLAQASRAIAKGDLEYSVPGSRIREFRILARSLERTIGNLKRSQVQLADYSRSLETMVEERTAALRRSEAKFEKAFRCSPDPIFIATLEGGRIIEANDSFLVGSGYTLAEVIQHRLHDLNLLGNSEELEIVIEKLLQNCPVRDVEAQSIAKSGERRTVLFSAEILNLEETPCVLYIARDITESKKIETELKQSKQYLRLVLDNIPQQIFWKNRDSVFLGCNKNWAEAACLESAEAVVNLRDEDLLPPEAAAAAEKFREIDRRIMSNNKAEYNTLEVKQRPDSSGNPVWLSVSKIPIHDERGEAIGILGAIEDITERKIADEKRKTAEEALRVEQEKSEQLLLNILPEAIAEQLKQDPSPIAEQFDDVAILFADLVGFTALSASLPARRLVQFLNRIFSEFDRLAKSYGLEKIKTIGDAYMVAGGLPLPKDDCLEAIAEMALEIQKSIVRIAVEWQQPLQIRIGINLGPVVAGVIGETKFIYDLWGDTVNVASRMESLGEPGRIQTTQTVYERLKYFYEFEERGEIEVKGKGKITTYWLLGRKNCMI